VSSAGPPLRFEPPIGPASGPFWEATRRGQLVLPWCIDCGRPFFYPRDVCPRCLGSAIEWRPASGAGVVYSFSIEQRPPPIGFSMGKPFVMALVDLEEGVRLMTNVVGCPPEAVEVGMPVSVTWEALSDGRQLPLFEPSPGGTTS
jgi:uncharacterized OB-fold protein